MFGIGLGEIIIIGIIALLVVGPDKLPELATKVGRFVWDIRRAWDDVRDSVRSEMMTIKQPFDDIRKTGRETRDIFTTELKDVKTSADKALQDVKNEIKAAAEPPAPSPDGSQATPLPDGSPGGETIEAAKDAQQTNTVTAAAPAPVAASGPQPYKRKAPPPPSVTYFDLDGNPVEAAPAPSLASAPSAPSPAVPPKGEPGLV